MSLPHPLARLDRFGVVNSFLLSAVITPNLSFPVASAVATACLAAWSGARLALPRWRRYRWNRWTWVVVSVLGMRAARRLPAFQAGVDFLLPDRFFAVPSLGFAGEAVRGVVFEGVWRGIVYFTLLRAGPALAPMAPIAIPVLAIAVVVLPFSLAAFIASTTAVLAYETTRALYLSLFPTSDLAAALLDFRRLAIEQFDAESVYLIRQHELDSLVANKVNLSDISPALFSLGQHWLRVLSLPSPALLALCKHYSFAASLSPTSDPRFSPSSSSSSAETGEGIDPLLLLPSFTRLKSLLDAAYASRPAFTQDSSFLSATYQLVGLLIAWVPPFSLLRSLRPLVRHRTPRKQLALHLLLTPPLARYLLHPSTAFFAPSDFPPPSAPPETEDPDVFSAFLDALARYFRAAQRAGWRSETVAQVLGEWLPLEEARARAVRAEEGAHEAVLGAVLLWKERKEVASLVNAA
ncbi:hypothetical protein JCM8097_005957 [Rhodosporidiobolus ruineniae]